MGGCADVGCTRIAASKTAARNSWVIASFMSVRTGIDTFDIGIINEQVNKSKVKSNIARPYTQYRKPMPRRRADVSIPRICDKASGMYVKGPEYICYKHGISRNTRTRRAIPQHQKHPLPWQSVSCIGFLISTCNTLQDETEYWLAPSIRATVDLMEARTCDHDGERAQVVYRHFSSSGTISCNSFPMPRSPAERLVHRLCPYSPFSLISLRPLSLVFISSDQVKWAHESASIDGCTEGTKTHYLITTTILTTLLQSQGVVQVSAIGLTTSQMGLSKEKYLRSTGP